MIIKGLDLFTSTDAFAKSGRRAEEQMAFYLSRAFASSPHVRILNGIRLEAADDAAQMDHLILHRWGIVIMESKSVTSQVEINERGEWTRLWNGKPKGMASPVLQARRQGDFLRRQLEDNAEKLLGKIFGVMQAHFGSMPVDVIVAISDDGIIKQPKKPVEEAVCKADQVPDRVQSLMERHKKASSIFSLNLKGGYQWSEQEIERITSFLLQHHKPLSASTASVSEEVIQEPVQSTPTAMDTSPAVVPAAQTAPTEPAAAPRFSCRACQSDKLTVEYGRYGYYFKCADCDANTPIKLTCSGCGEKARVRKSGNQFFEDCQSCGKSDLFYTNASASTAASPIAGN